MAKWPPAAVSILNVCYVGRSNLRSGRLSSRIVTIVVSVLLLVPLAQAAFPFVVSAATSSTPLVGAWNSNVGCTPTTVRITDITANQTGTTSFNTSPFSPGITTSVSGGVAKRWLTPGPTPSGWHSPGPACTITNNFGKQQGVFVEIDGVKRASTTFEDSSTSYDPTNGGGSYGKGTFNDFTFNIFDPAIVPNYGTSCTKASDPTCYGRIHLEIDHDWQAAQYCGTGTACDPNALASQTTDGVTLIDFQGFVYWDPANLNANYHQFSGWELHPLTGWRMHQVSLTVGISFNPTSPVAGQSVTFTGTASGGTSPYTFSWNFGDGATATGNPVTHAYSTAGSYAAQLSVVDSKGVSGSTSKTVTVGPSSTPDFSFSSSPSSLTISGGSSGAATISLASLNSFSGAVSLSSTVSPSGLSASLNPTTVTLSSGGSGSSILSVSSSTAGSYTVTVIGTSGSLSHSTIVAVTVTSPTSVLVASDSAVGPVSLGSGGSEKLILDSAGRIIAVYVDSLGRIGLSYANSNPISTGWSTPVKSSTPSSPYARPAAILISLTSLRIITEGGAGIGQITAIPVTVQRDAQNSITGFTFGTATVLDSSGTTAYPTAVAAHNGDILAAWAFKTATTSQVRSLRWDPSTGWTNFAGTFSTPDNLIIDNSGLEWMIPNIIERPDNNNIYLLANRLSAPPSTLAYNLATWSGASWSWGTQNLTYETNASSGVEDSVTFAWDPVASLVVVSYGITGTQSYGVFTLNSANLKTHLDTPSLPITERDWGTISVHTTTGDYYIFLMNVNTDGGSGTLGYIRHPVGGVWDSSLTLIDSATNNQGLNARATGTSPTLDILYVQGTSSPTSVRFVRISPFNPPNFSVSTSPAALTIQAGSSGTFTITVNSLNSFTGTVSLSATVSPSGLTASLNPTSVSVTSGGTGTSTLTVTSTTSGTYTVSVVATNGSLSHSCSVTVNVADFTLSASSSLTVATGAPKSSPISLTSLNGFAGTIGLTTSASASGLTSSVSPTSVTLTSSGTGTTTLTLNSNTVGTYTVTVTATSGSLSHSLTISVSVVASPDFGIAAAPSTVTFPVGSSGTSTVTLTSLNGFAGSLTISRTITPSTGLTAACTPTSVTLTSGGSATSTCNFNSSTTGTYTVTVSATNGTLTHSTTISVNVSEFSISASPTSTTIISTTSGSSTITLTSLNGFAGTVSLGLSAPAGITTSLTQTSLGLSSGGTATSTLTFSSTTIGNYTLTITATSGSLVHSVQVMVWVVDFGISTGSSSLTVFAGQSGGSSITLNSLGGFVGSVTLNTIVSPSGLTASVNPASVSLASNGSVTSTLTISSSTGGTYIVTVTGTSGGVSHSVQVTVNVMDYTISANPSALGFQTGSNGSSTITLTSLGGFSGTIGLAASATPSGLTISCNPTSISITSGSSDASTCTFSSSTEGTYTVMINATSGALSHTTTLTVGVGDFTISSSPSNIAILAGSSGSSTITLTSLAGFTGTINLSTSVTPAGLTSSLNPISVNLSPGGTSTSTLTVTSSAPGTFTVNVTGTSGSSSRSVTITVNVQDFSLATNPSSLSLAPSSSGTVAINLASINGFAGTVSLSASCSPSGPRLSLSSNSIILTSGGSGTATLTVRIPHKTPPGSYAITIVATSGGITHTITVALTVT